MTKLVAYLCLLVLLIQLSHIVVAAPATDSNAGSVGIAASGSGETQVIFVDDGTPDNDTYADYNVPGDRGADIITTPAPNA